MEFFKRSLIAFALFPLFSLAQANYKPGYAVTLKGDTLRGFIDFREWDKTPTTINFKSSENDKIIKLSVQNIKYFSIGDAAEYYRYAGIITTDPINPDKMISERDTSFRIDTVFLELIQRGKSLALYSYSDHLKTRFYIGESPDYTPTELGYRLYWDVDKSTTGRTVNEDTYQKQLFALAIKYNMLSDPLIKYIEESNYREDHLIRIVGMINNITKTKSKKKH